MNYIFTGKKKHYLTSFDCAAAHDRKLGHKRKHNIGGSDDEDSDDAGDGGKKFSVDPSALEGYRKRRRATLEER